MESHNAHAGQGSVVLDIGGDVGALIVDMPADLVGVEIEIKAVDQGDHAHHEHPVTEHPDHHDSAHDHSHRPHVAVVLRPTASGVVPSAVFPELVEGSYELYLRSDSAASVHVRASVRGGEVAYASWPASI